MLACNALLIVAGSLCKASSTLMAADVLYVLYLCVCRRDRLAVITQLLVPLLLVLLAMMVSTLETSHHQQPPLEFSRQTCLFGSPALLAAAPAVRQQVEFRGLMDGYSRWALVWGYCWKSHSDKSAEHWLHDDNYFFRKCCITIHQGSDG